MAIDERPSIAALLDQCRMIKEGKMSASDDIDDAAPVLLEVIAALIDGRADVDESADHRVWRDMIDRALAKVRP